MIYARKCDSIAIKQKNVILQVCCAVIVRFFEELSEEKIVAFIKLAQHKRCTMWVTIEENILLPDKTDAAYKYAGD
jgi:uncharacterized OsmC-like protein